MRKVDPAAKKANESPSKKYVDWDKIRERIAYLQTRGAEVVNRHNAPRTVQLPLKPGLTLLGACDCLVNHGGFTRIRSEEETSALMDLRASR